MAGRHLRPIVYQFLGCPFRYLSNLGALWKPNISAKATSTSACDPIVSNGLSSLSSKVGARTDARDAGDGNPKAGPRY